MDTEQKKIQPTIRQRTTGTHRSLLVKQGQKPKRAMCCACGQPAVIIKSTQPVCERCHRIEANHAKRVEVTRAPSMSDRFYMPYAVNLGRNTAGHPASG